MNVSSSRAWFAAAFVLAACGTPSGTDGGDASPTDARHDAVPVDVTGHDTLPPMDVPMGTDTPTPMDVPVGTDTPTPIDVPVAIDTPTPMDVPVATDVPVPTDTPIVPADASVITPGTPPASDVRFTIDSTMNVAPISRYIYGHNAPDWTGARGVTMTRLGGNRMTAYNWETNASNAGSDYIYSNDNYLSASSTPGEVPRAEVADAFAHNASTIITVPMAGYVAGDEAGAVNIATYPSYLATRFRVNVAHKPTAFSLTPDTSDANVYQDEFVNWLEHTFPGAHSDPVRSVFYMLDNEPDLWSSTHAEIHPMPATYAEMVTRSTALATAIKNVAPTALIFGPVNYGWQGYVNLQNAPDAASRDFIDFFLDSMHSAETTAGHRLLDVLDLHWYPEAQGGGQRISDTTATSAAANDARVQAPRSLWDSTYTETSWITMYSTLGPINLIPRMTTKIGTHYPGTRLSFSEYNYGGANDISGAVAEADVLGVFGRYGVFAASVWPLAASEPFINLGIEAYRNYDGAGATFGDTSIHAADSDTARSSVYASVDAGHPERMVVVAINKTTSALTAAISAAHTMRFGHAEVWQITAAHTTIQHLADVPITLVNAFQYAMPARSVSVLVLRP